MANIALNKNSVNIITPTLFEKTTLSPVYYLFEFINKQTFAKSYCIPTELSTELQRYNKFSIEDTANPVALSGEVDLSAGSYEYNVYEQLSSTNLVPTGLDIVEAGMCKVYDSTTHTNTEYPVAAVTNTQYE